MLRYSSIRVTEGDFKQRRCHLLNLCNISERREKHVYGSLMERYWRGKPRYSEKNLCQSIFPHSRTKTYRLVGVYHLPVWMNTKPASSTHKKRRHNVKYPNTVWNNDRRTNNVLCRWLIQDNSTGWRSGKITDWKLGAVWLQSVYGHRPFCWAKFVILMFLQENCQFVSQQIVQPYVTPILTASLNNHAHKKEITEDRKFLPCDQW
jgi:hypothetical protein